MWSPPFSRPTRRRRRIHINLADFYAPVELILASITWPRFLRPPLADPPAGQLPPWPRRGQGDLRRIWRVHKTKDDHRGNQTKHGNRDATELACGCGVFPRRAAARDAPAVWCFLPPGRVAEVAIARPWALGSDDRRMAATNKCSAQSNKSPDCNGAYKSLMRFKSWLIAINTGARDNPDACTLAPL